MTITGNTPEENEIINEFNTKLRTFVQTNTNWVGTTVVWNTTVGGILNTQAPGNYTTNVNPGAPVAADILPDVSAKAGASNSLREVFLAWMKVYSKSHLVRLNNTGNLGPASYSGIYRFITTDREVAAVTTDTTSSFTTNSVLSLSNINKTNLQNLINALQTIWTNRCKNTIQSTFSYNYCHSSCHGSRSRR